ncbi:MAG: glucan 1,4-alpha-glucosidase, partial [Acidimicrobiia bacterium]
SAMPLCWAHAEYLRLRRSLRDGKVFDMPVDTFDRYVKSSTPSTSVAWNRSQKCRTIPHGMGLRILLRDPATIRWTSDAWSTHHDVKTVDTGLGVHTTMLPTGRLDEGTTAMFTFRFADRWEGANYEVTIDRPNGR